MDKNHPCDIHEDKRPIKAVYNENFGASVELNYVTEIVPYQEYSQNGIVTWFAIYKGDFLAERVASTGMVVEYQEAEHE